MATVIRAWTLCVMALAVVVAQEQPANPGIVAVFPPPESERAKPGTEIFLVCSFQAGKPERTACLYEYRPSTTNFIKRAELVRSDWAPTLELLPEFLRQQVPGPNEPYETWLYSVDYRTWQIRRVLVSNMIFGMAANESRAYFRTDKGIRVIDRQTLAVSPMNKPARELDSLDGNTWLVHYDGDADAVAHVYDFKREADLGKVDLPKGYDRRNEVPKLAPTKNFVAFFHYLGEKRMFESVRSTVRTEFTICDLATGSSRTLPVIVYIAYRPTSGEPSEYVKLDWGFSDDGLSFRYVTALKAGESAKKMEEVQGGFEAVVVDLKSGKESRSPYQVPAKQVYKRPMDFFIPPYLKGLKVELPRDAVSGLLDAGHAEHALRNNAALAAGYSSDTKRFLAFIPTADGSYQWMFGDLEAKRIVKIDAPKYLYGYIGDIHAVIVPGDGVPKAEGLPRYIGD